MLIETYIESALSSETTFLCANCSADQLPITITIYTTQLKTFLRWGDKMPKSDLRDAGLKVTVPRLQVLEVLEEAEPHHLSAEDVYRKLLDTGESIGLATVYRVLTQFESANIVERHNFDDGRAVYELKSEEHHDHMVDIETGSVYEFVNNEIEELQRKVVESRGFELVDHELVLYVRKKPNP